MRKNKEIENNSLIINDKRKRKNKEPRYHPFIIKSPTRYNKKYQLDDNSEMYNAVKGLQKSSSLIRLYDLFYLYNRRIHSGKQGRNMVNDVFVNITNDEFEDLLYGLKLNSDVEIKKISGNMKSFPFYNGIFTQTRLTLQKMDQVRDLFSIFKNFKPDCEYYQTSLNTEIPKEDYIKMEIGEKQIEQDYLGCYLSLEKCKGIRKSFHICFNQIPGTSGGYLFFKYWYEISKNCNNNVLFRFPSCSKRKYTDEELGFIPLTPENHGLSDQVVSDYRSLESCLFFHNSNKRSKIVREKELNF